MNINIFKLGFITTLFFLISCSSQQKAQPNRLEHRGIASNIQFLPTPKHPAIDLFFNYAQAIKNEKPFNEVIKQFHPAEDIPNINTSVGWQRYPYIAAMIGLTKGLCQNASWKKNSHYRIQIDCHGPFLLQSMILGDSKEQMHFRLFINKRGDNWKIGRSGLAYTQTFGQPEINTDIAQLGLKFKHNLLKN